MKINNMKKIFILLFALTALNSYSQGWSGNDGTVIHITDHFGITFPIYSKILCIDSGNIYMIKQIGYSNMSLSTTSHVSVSGGGTIGPTGATGPTGIQGVTGATGATGSGGGSSDYISLTASNYYAFGTSFTCGGCSTTWDSSYVGRLNNYLHTTITPYCIAGNTVRDAALQIFSAPIKDSTVSIYEFGINESVNENGDSNKIMFRQSSLAELYWIGLTPKNKVIGRDSTDITYYGSWNKHSTSVGYTIGSYCNSIGDSLVYNFYGNSIIIGTELWSKKLKIGGKFNVYLDNVLIDSSSCIDVYIDSTFNHSTMTRPLALEYNNLVLNYHKLKIVSVDTGRVCILYLATLPNINGNKLPIIYENNIMAVGYGTLIVYNNNIKQFNNIIYNNAFHLASLGINIYVVDVASACNNSTDLCSGIHPNNSGCKKMADAIYAAMNMVEQPREKNLSTNNPFIICNNDSIEFNTLNHSNSLLTPTALITNKGFFIQDYLDRTIDSVQIKTGYPLLLEGYTNSSFIIDTVFFTINSTKGSVPNVIPQIYFGANNRHPRDSVIVTPNNIINDSTVTKLVTLVKDTIAYGEQVWIKFLGASVPPRDMTVVVHRKYVSYALKQSSTPLPFNPLSIAGCQFWGDYSSFIYDGSNNISQWTDNSGSGHNLTATGTLQPLYVPNQNNGYAVARFNSVNPSELTSTFTMTQPFTMFVVHRLTGAASVQVILYDNATSFGFYLDCLSGALNISCGSGNVGSGFANAPYGFMTLSAEANGASSFTRANGTTLATGNCGTHGFTILGLGGVTSTFPITGDVSELIIYNSALTPTQVTQVETYLHAKYNDY